MMRTAIVLALLLSAAVMIRGVASDWRKSPISSPVEVSTKKGATPGSAAPLSQAKGLKPVVPGGVLADLKVGYLFNQERMLANAEPPSDHESNANMDATSGIGASIDQVIYVGSIITETFSRALIAYPMAAHTAPQPALPYSTRSRSPAPSAGGSEEHAQLKVGEMLGGYKLAEILPDKLIFSRGDEKVEKLLYDPGKKRKAPPPKAAAAPAGGPTPSSAARATTIGEVTSPPVGTPGMVNTPPAANPSASPAVAPATTPLSPLRRGILSRRPPASSDTTGPKPLPPGVNANDSLATPPIPGGN